MKVKNYNPSRNKKVNIKEKRKFGSFLKKNLYNNNFISVKQMLHGNKFNY